jgi:hypothetical protein
MAQEVFAPMHDQDSSERPETSTLDQDRQTEFNVLEFLLGEHPAQITESEVVLFRGWLRIKGAPTFGETDDVERAVGQLVGAGLVRRQGESLIPTRAARYFNWLSEER